MHQRHVIDLSLLIHGFLSVNARLLIACGTAFYAIIRLRTNRLNTDVADNMQNEYGAPLFMQNIKIVLVGS